MAWAALRTVTVETIPDGDSDHSVKRFLIVVGHSQELPDGLYQFGLASLLGQCLDATHLFLEGDDAIVCFFGKKHIIGVEQHFFILAALDQDDFGVTGAEGKRHILLMRLVNFAVAEVSIG